VSLRSTTGYFPARLRRARHSEARMARMDAESPVAEDPSPSSRLGMTGLTCPSAPHRSPPAQPDDRPGEPSRRYGAQARGRRHRSSRAPDTTAEGNAAAPDSSGIARLMDTLLCNEPRSTSAATRTAL